MINIQKVQGVRNVEFIANCGNASLQFVGIHVLVRRYPSQVASVLSLLRISQSHRQRSLVTCQPYCCGRHPILTGLQGAFRWTKVGCAAWVFLGGATFVRRSITTYVFTFLYIFAHFSWFFMLLFEHRNLCVHIFCICIFRFMHICSCKRDQLAYVFSIACLLVWFLFLFWFICIYLCNLCVCVCVSMCFPSMFFCFQYIPANPSAEALPPAGSLAWWGASA